MLIAHAKSAPKLPIRIPLKVASRHLMLVQVVESTSFLSSEDFLKDLTPKAADVEIMLTQQQLQVRWIWDITVAGAEEILQFSLIVYQALSFLDYHHGELTMEPSVRALHQQSK